MLEIKINTENLIDSPYSESTKSAFIFEDEEFLEQIVQELKKAHPSDFVVSGYRSVGKTSFVGIRPTKCIFFSVCLRLSFAL